MSIALVEREWDDRNNREEAHMSTALVDQKSNCSGPRTYALGYSTAEFKRLEQQAAFPLRGKGFRSGLGGGGFVVRGGRVLLLFVIGDGALDGVFGEDRAVDFHRRE